MRRFKSAAVIVRMKASAGLTWSVVVGHLLGVVEEDPQQARFPSVSQVQLPWKVSEITFGWALEFAGHALDSSLIVRPIIQ